MGHGHPHRQAGPLHGVCRLQSQEAFGWEFFSPNSNSFGVLSHSKGFGAELLSDSPWFSGADLC